MLVVFWIRRSPPAPSATLRERLARHRFVLLGLASLALYFAMPDDINGASHIYKRYLPPAAALFFVAFCPTRERFPVVAKVLASLVPLVVVITALPQFVIATNMSEDLDALLPHIDEGSAVANLDFNPESAEGFFYPGVMGPRVVTARGGRVLYSFFDSSIAPVMIAKPYWWSDAVARHNARVADFEPAFDLVRFRYVLLFTADYFARAS